MVDRRVAWVDHALAGQDDQRFRIEVPVRLGFGEGMWLMNCPTMVEPARLTTSIRKKRLPMAWRCCGSKRTTRSGQALAPRHGAEPAYRVFSR